MPFMLFIAKTCREKYRCRGGLKNMGDTQRILWRELLFVKYESLRNCGVKRKYGVNEEKNMVKIFLLVVENILEGVNAIFMTYPFFLLR